MRFSLEPSLHHGFSFYRNIQSLTVALYLPITFTPFFRFFFFFLIFCRTEGIKLSQSLENVYICQTCMSTRPITSTVLLVSEALKPCKTLNSRHFVNFLAKGGSDSNQGISLLNNKEHH